MVLGWRKAFCTSISRQTDSTAIDQLEYNHNISNSSSTTPKFGTRFGFFTSSSNPSTPRPRSHSGSSPSPSPSLTCRTTATVPAPSRSAPLSPKLQCETNNYNSPRVFLRSSNPSSPRSPSPFSFLKSSLRLYTRRCGLCSQSVKKGQGTATFTAECSHTFHFPCISDHVKKQGSLACPLCSCLWKEMPMLSVDDQNKKNQLVDEYKTREKLSTRFVDDIIVTSNESPKLKLLRPDLKVYNDDEPLASLTPKARFNPIPESDENFDEDSINEEFQGFFVSNSNDNPVMDNVTDVEVCLLPDTAVIAASRRHETHAIVLKIKAPSICEKVQRRAPIDLVTVVDVSGKISSEKLQMVKKAMRSIILSLSSSDRLSIVAFSSHSKRLLPLRRMTTSGRRSARRLVEAMAVIAGCSNSKDAVKKALKVLEDRREKNHAASVFLLSDVSSTISSGRYFHSRVDIPIHSIDLGVMMEDHISNLLTLVVQDLHVRLGFGSCSSPAVITAVYSRIPQPVVLGSNTVRLGDLSAGEVRELLVELKVPSSTLRSHRVLSVQCSYNESLSQELIYGKQHALLVPRPATVRSSSPTIQRLRSVFISTRALAESRRLVERNDLLGAYHMLVSARALMLQYNLDNDDEFLLGLEAELRELQQRRKDDQTLARIRSRGEVKLTSALYTDEKGEPLTPTSAWRAADKLAKVAMMRKSVNRVSDLHGFEDARF